MNHYNRFEMVPSAKICDREINCLFIKFCTLMCIMYNKKLNLANIFLLILKEDKVGSLYKSICEFDSDFEGIKFFLEYDSSLHKSKYIKKYLNAEGSKFYKKR